MPLEAGWVLTYSSLVTPMPLGVLVSTYDTLQDWKPVGARPPARLWQHGKLSLLPDTPEHPPSGNIFCWDALN